MNNVIYLKLRRKISVVKDEQIHKIKIQSKRSKVVFLSENSCHIMNLLIFDNIYSQLELNHVIHKSTAQSLNSKLGARLLRDLLELYADKQNLFRIKKFGASR